MFDIQIDCCLQMGVFVFIYMSRFWFLIALGG